MKKYLILTAVLLAAAGCGPSFRQVTLTVDPPDAQIEVIGQGNPPDASYHSPATISVPLDQALVGQGRIVISHKDYKKKELKLSALQEDSIAIKLEKVVRYHLKYSMAGPVESADLTYRDKTLAVTIELRDAGLDLKIENRAQKPVTIYWDTAEYTDIWSRPHKIFPSSVRLEERSNLIPPDTVPVGGSLQVLLTPVDSVTPAGAKGYVVKPLFMLDHDSAPDLKGRIVKLSFPIAIDGAIIIPGYTFKIRIDDVIKD